MTKTSETTHIFDRYLTSITMNLLPEKKEFTPGPVCGLGSPVTIIEAMSDEVYSLDKDGELCAKMVKLHERNGIKMSDDLADVWSGKKSGRIMALMADLNTLLNATCPEGYYFGPKTNGEKTMLGFWEKC